MYEIATELGTIEFKINNDDIPDDQQDFVLLATKANSILNHIFRDVDFAEDETYRKYFNELLSLTQTGLVGGSADPTFATRALNNFKGELLKNEGTKLKSRYLKRYGILLIKPLCGFSLFALILVFFSSNFTMLKNIYPYFIILSGSMLGKWMSAVHKKIDFEDYQFNETNEYHLEEGLRIVYNIIFCLIVYLIILTGFIELKIGNITTSSVQNDIRVSILLGVVIGLFEKEIAIKIIRKTQDSIE